MRWLNRRRVLAGFMTFLWVVLCVAVWQRPPVAPRVTYSETDKRNQVQLLGFSPDSRTLALTHEGKKSLLLWDVTTGRERFSIPIDEYLPQPDRALSWRDPDRF